LLLLAALPAQAAQRLGNGTDHHAFGDNAAWFEHQPKVRYCIGADARFGFGAEALAAEIEAARATWQAYLERLRTPLAANVLPPYERMARCDGTQDLRFAFGVEDQQVKDAAMDLRLTAPTAFAYLLSRDLEAHVGKGLVWIAPPGDADPYPQWTVPHTLRTILVHEIGHTLGSDHVDGTVMCKGLERFLEYEMSHPGAYGEDLARIDWVKDLVPCMHCALSIGGTVDDRAFATLVGRAPAGGATATLWTAGSRDAAFVATRWQLAVTDARGTSRFDFTIEADVAAMPFNGIRGPTVMRVTPLVAAGPNRPGISFDHFATYSTARIAASGGRSLPVILGRNMDDRKVSLRAIVDGRELLLFRLHSPLAGVDPDL
jgi:hypothetical protein